MSKRGMAVRIIAATLAVVMLAWFAYANFSETVDVDFIVFTLRGISLAVVIYAALIVGMLAALAVGLRADLRFRRQLKRQGWPRRPETVDPGAASTKPRSPDAELGGKTTGG